MLNSLSPIEAATGIALQQYLTVAAILFTLGVFGIFLNRKNVIIILMSIELMLLAVNINLVAMSAYLNDITGPDLRAHRFDGGRGRGSHRACHCRDLFPEPRLNRRRRHQLNEGLRHDVSSDCLDALGRGFHCGFLRPYTGR